jgi:hypothetical protein
MLFCAMGASRAQSVRIGFVGGLAHFLSSLYWLLAMPFDWHGIPLAPGLAWILLRDMGMVLLENPASHLLRIRAVLPRSHR